jgi:hypothetical protein
MTKGSHVFSVNKFYDEYVGSNAWHVKNEEGTIFAIVYNEILAHRIKKLLIESDF